MTLANTLKTKDFILLAEMETPKGVDISEFVEDARHLKGRVDAVLIPDMNFAVMRMAALAGAVVLKEQGLESVVQFSCRDRNRIALQGDLLGAHVLGLGNVMAVAGQALEMGDHQDARAVNDLDVPGFLAAVQSLSQGRDLGGRELKGRPEFCLGARIEPWLDPAQAKVRIAEAAQAVEHGAQYLIAPPVFDTQAFKGFMDQAASLGVPILGSVLLLKSVGMARYLNQNLPGTNISEETIMRIRKASDRPAECVKIAGETLAALKGVCQGALIVTTGWEDRLPGILDAGGF